MLQQKIQTLEEENERLKRVLEKNRENSHTGKLHVRKVNESQQRNSAMEKIEPADVDSSPKGKEVLNFFVIISPASSQRIHNEMIVSGHIMYVV